jgi:hypothetical protein
MNCEMDGDVTRIAKIMAVAMGVVVLLATGVTAGVDEDLLSAAARGDISKVGDLISNGAGVNAEDNDGVTSLMNASVGGYPKVVKALLNKGADINARNMSFRVLWHAYFS